MFCKRKIKKYNLLIDIGTLRFQISLVSHIKLPKNGKQTCSLSTLFEVGISFQSCKL